MKRPNFFIIGAAKSATSSLASLLDNHPQCVMTKPKEPHFFSFENHYRHGMALYDQHVAHTQDELMVGDASTSYSRIRQHPHIIQRLYDYDANAKIIYMVRHPIKRIESAYVEQMTVPQNQQIKSINEAIQKLPMMVDSSRYWEVYSEYRKHFKKRQIKIVWFEEYIADKQTVFSSVCEFLGLDPNVEVAEDKEKSNTREYAMSRVQGSAELDSTWDPKLLKKIKRELQKDTRKFFT